MWNETRTETEKYNAELARTKELFDKGAIDAETYGRKVTQINNQIAESHKSAFGEQATQALSNFAAAFNPSITAAQILKGTLEEIGKLKQEAASADRSAEMAEGRLDQVAGRDPLKAQQLRALSRSVAASAGMSRSQAAELTFTAASATGGLDDLPLFAQLYEQGQDPDPRKLLESTDLVRSAVGQQQAGSRRDVLSRLVAAGEHSLKSIGELAPAASGAALFAKDAGINIDEVLAAVAVQSKVMDVSKAGTSQAALEKTLARLRSAPEVGAGIRTDDEGNIIDQKTQQLRADAAKYLKLARPGLMNQLQAIQEMHLDPGQTLKLFGRQEALGAYNALLTNQPEYEAAVKQISAAPKEDAVGQMLALSGSDPNLAAVRDRRVEQAKVAAAAEEWGPEQNAIDAIFAHKEADELRMGKISRAGFDKWYESDIMSLVPGARAAAARKLIREKQLDDDKKLLVRSVQALGGEDVVMGGRAAGAPIPKAGRRLRGPRR